MIKAPQRTADTPNHCKGVIFSPKKITPANMTMTGSNTESIEACSGVIYSNALSKSNIGITVQMLLKNKK